MDYFTREIVGPGQPVQLQLKTVSHPHIWKAGKLRQGHPTTLVLSDSESEGASQTDEREAHETVLESIACNGDSQEEVPTWPSYWKAIGG